MHQGSLWHIENLVAHKTFGKWEVIDLYPYRIGISNQWNIHKSKQLYVSMLNTVSKVGLMVGSLQQVWTSHTVKPMDGPILNIGSNKRFKISFFHFDFNSYQWSID